MLLKHPFLTWNYIINVIKLTKLNQLNFIQPIEKSCIFFLSDNILFRIFDGMAKPAFLFDGRKMLDHQKLMKMGFHVETIGTRLSQR